MRVSLGAMLLFATSASGVGEVSEPRWLPPLEQTSDTDPDPGSTVSRAETA
jgi:hypothetical protein|tara:strand:- start:3248 stop:3400 length:153 start_codon:yes stop_codon:yes gene_type:complete